MLNYLLDRRWLLDWELATGEPPVPAAQQAHRRGRQQRTRAGCATELCLTYDSTGSLAMTLYGATE